MNLFTWVMILLSFGVIKYMIYTEYTTEATAPDIFDFPSFPRFDINNGTLETVHVRDCDGAFSCLGAIGDIFHNVGVWIYNFFAYIINAIKAFVSIIVYTYDLITYAVKLLFFNSFGDSTPWYVKTLINIPMIFALGMLLIKFVASLFGGGSDEI